MIPVQTPEIGIDAYSVVGGASEWARSGRLVIGGHAPPRLRAHRLFPIRGRQACLSLPRPIPQGKTSCAEQ